MSLLVSLFCVSILLAGAGSERPLRSRQASKHVHDQLSDEVLGPAIANISIAPQKMMRDDPAPGECLEKTSL